jgi:hypothetical protein
LPAQQRRDLGLQVLQLARGADLAAIETLSVPVDPRSDLLDVGLGLGLLAPQITVAGGQRSGRVAQFTVPGVEPLDLSVLGKSAPAMLDPAKLGV